MLFHTDGISEAMDASGRLLDEPGLLGALNASSVPPEQRIARLHDVVDRHRGGQNPEDDQTLLLFRPNDRAPRMSLRERLASTARMLKVFAGALRPGSAPIPWPELNLPNVGGFLLPSLGRRWRGGS